MSVMTCPNGDGASHETPQSMPAGLLEIEPPPKPVLLTVIRTAESTVNVSVFPV